jgi:hypothetical protein
MNTCKATTRIGKPCKANPLSNGLCLFHSAPGKASELGRKGGRGNRHTPPDRDAEPFNPPKTLRDVRDTLANLMADVAAGRRDVKVVNSCAYIATSLLKAIEVTDIEERLSKLEAQK